MTNPLFNPESNPAFTLYGSAQQRVPFVFNSPHSGRDYPAPFIEASRLDKHTIRQSEDFYVDELFAGVVPLGAPFLVANFPRAFLDVNREPYELDQKMFSDRLPSYVNASSIRVAGGLGTIARIVAESKEIYAHPLKVEDALERIDTIYKPYHDNLRKLLARTHVEFGYSVLVDCHSMPSNARSRDQRIKPDIIVGDRYRTSCAGELSDAMVAAFRDLGYTTARNKPYAGGFITEHYGRPLRGLHAIQVEINRGLYMNEQTLRRTVGFEQLQRDITKVMDHITSIPDDAFHPLPQAAE